MLLFCVFCRPHSKVTNSNKNSRLSWVSLKEHYHVFAHAQDFDFRTGGQEIKDAGIDIELSQIRLHRPQSTLALP